MMESDSHHASPRAIAAMLLLGVALGGGGDLGGRGERPPPEPVEAPANVPTVEPAPVIPPPLGRADLLSLVATATDAYAEGRELDDKEQRAGRRFAIRIPFGCGGPSKEKLDPLGWTYEEETETLRLRATPQQWADVPWVEARLAESEMESVEGFWVPRPWTSSEACPRTADATPGDPSETLGIAHFFGPDSPRRGQRGDRAFETVKKLDPKALAPGTGFHLLLEGRLAALPKSGTVICHGEATYRRPTCLVSAEFDRVAIENPADGELLAEWQF